jgi:hypothetical protein
VTAPADLDVLQRVLRESGVDQTPPGPSWSGYMVALLEAFFEWLGRHLPSLRGLRELPNVLGPAFALAAIGLVALVLLAVIRAAVRPRRDVPRPGLTSARRTAARAPVAERDRDGWQRELDRRLTAGDLRGALEALWWWFARALTTARVDPAWTSRELLAHTQRRELGGLALTLDRLLYGAPRPRAEDIDAFRRRVEEALP